MKKLLLLWASLFVLVAVSCKENETATGTDAPDLVVFSDEVDISFLQQEIPLGFICKGKWKAAIACDGPKWLSFSSRRSGRGNGKLLLSVLANDEKIERIATVTISSGNRSIPVQVRQGGKKWNITFRHPSIAFTDEQFNKLKTAYSAGAPSLKAALDLTIEGASVSYDPETVTTEQKQENKSEGVIYKTMQNPARIALFRSIAAKITDDKVQKDSFAKGAIDILYSWSLACKDVEYPIAKWNGVLTTGVFLTRCAWPFFFTYDCWKGTEYISAEQDAVIVAWFRNIEKAAKLALNQFETDDFFDKETFQNQIGSNMWGLLTIGYILDDAPLVLYALDSEDNSRDLCDMIQGAILMEGDKPCRAEKPGSVPPQNGEIYDRYRHQVAPLKGLQYAVGNLSFLSMAARTCYNNGIDMYAYTAPTGENLRLSYEFYAPFYEKMDSSLQGGYYSGEDQRMSRTGDPAGMFEIGLNAYPDSEPIQNVIASIKDRSEKGVQRHQQFGYLRLYSIDADPDS